MKLIVDSDYAHQASRRYFEGKGWIDWKDQLTSTPRRLVLDLDQRIQRMEHSRW